MIELEALNWSFQLLLYIYNMISGMSRADVKTSFSSYFFCKWSRPHISQHSFRRHEWTWMQRFRATSRDPSPNQCNIMGNFAFLKFNPCCSVYPRTAARQIRSYGSSAENPSAPAIGAQYLNVLPIMENWCSHWKKQRQSPAGTSCRHSPQKIRCSGAFLQLHRSWQESHSGCHLRNPLLLGIRKALLSLT